MYSNPGGTSYVICSKLNYQKNHPMAKLCHLSNLENDEVLLSKSKIKISKIGIKKLLNHNKNGNFILERRTQNH
jgi:hypothetical protein